MWGQYVVHALHLPLFFINRHNHERDSKGHKCDPQSYCYVFHKTVTTRLSQAKAIEIYLSRDSCPLFAHKCVILPYIHAYIYTYIYTHIYITLLLNFFRTIIPS